MFAWIALRQAPALYSYDARNRRWVLKEGV